MVLSVQKLVKSAKKTVVSSSPASKKGKGKKQVKEAEEVTVVEDVTSNGEQVVRTYCSSTSLLLEIRHDTVRRGSQTIKEDTTIVTNGDEKDPKLRGKRKATERLVDEAPSSRKAHRTTKEVVKTSTRRSTRKS